MVIFSSALWLCLRFAAAIAVMLVNARMIQAKRRTLTIKFATDRVLEVRVIKRTLKSIKVAAYSKASGLGYTV